MIKNALGSTKANVELTNSLFSIFSRGFTNLHDLFTNLATKDRILIAKKLKKLNKIIDNLEKQEMKKPTPYSY